MTSYAQADLLDLIADDRVHRDDKAAVVDAVRAAARLSDVISANEIRAHLAPWVQPQLVGATISGLRASGVLRPVGWTTNTDTHGRNAGKPTRTYSVDRLALERVK